MMARNSKGCDREEQDALRGYNSLSLLERVRDWLEGPAAPFWVAGAAFVLTLPSLLGGLSADDYYIRAVMVQEPDVPFLPSSLWDAFAFTKEGGDDMRHAMELGLVPWWAYPEGQVAFWRPASALTHWVDFTLFLTRAWLMHLQNILWYVALCLVLLVLYRRFFALSGTALGAAGLAALLYAVDDAHGMGVGWIANRNGLTAAVFGFLALVAHDSWRREGRRSGAWVGSACLAVGLLFGESAVAGCAYLFAYALLIDRGRPAVRFATLVPYAAIVLVWRATYTRLGYAVVGSGLYIDPGENPIRFVIHAAQRMPVLVLGQLGLPNSALATVVSPFWAYVHAAGAALFILFVVWVLWSLLRRNRASQFFALGMVLALVPFCATLPNDRLLFFSGFGGMGLVSQFLTTLPERLAEGARVRRSAVRALAWFWGVVHLVLAPLMLSLATLIPVAFGRPLHWAADTLPSPEHGGQLVVVTVPTDLMLSYLPVVRAARGEGTPLPFRLLTSGFTPVTVRRTGDKTLCLRVEGGLLARPWNQTFRDPTHRFKAGDVVRLKGLTVEVTATTPDGRPEEISCSFDVSLEDPSLSWVTWSERGFVTFDMPGISETVEVRRLGMFWWL